jgi:hypothetical protein
VSLLLLYCWTTVGQGGVGGGDPFGGFAGNVRGQRIHVDPQVQHTLTQTHTSTVTVSA